ncbi:hypothetical protein COV24_02710 [candidate division WWE3 bacterium CG10_big_fil_rev_8_21_14_0_10_32_10]|uniref:Uncharacterized protein n=1 Tax=candidate division WWE3 bacterium CG10_big_fil_rev_8_21_14_0_10_32_10 TaxID=1975090 RepID=A0A2H0RA80_UNCKA|nr:MAG: hypothetical protein COV24_02710 [candidate division WWE3 bacterium CG10_big_fil_rev_8_21_14_0_10_32_10]
MGYKNIKNIILEVVGIYINILFLPYKFCIYYIGKYISVLSKQLSLFLKKSTQLFKKIKKSQIKYRFSKVKISIGVSLIKNKLKVLYKKRKYFFIFLNNSNKFIKKNLKKYKLKIKKVAVDLFQFTAVVKPKINFLKYNKKLNIKKPKFRFLFVFKNIIFQSFILVVGICGLIFYYSVIYTLPNVDTIKTYRPKQTSYFYDNNNNLIYKTYSDEDRTIVTLKDIPTNLINAFVAIEDQNFYKHIGVSVPGIIRAAYANYKNQEITQGGSTITQQLIKNTLLTPERTWERKIKEIILSVLLERKYTKNQILEMYLNTIPFGGTSYGVETASLMYFNKHVGDLNLGESAMLAGLPVAPSKYTPYNSLEMAKERQKMVLVQMVKDNYINLDDALVAYQQKLNLAYPENLIKYPHFSYYVSDYLESKYGLGILNSGGLRVYTSLEPQIQDMAQEIVKSEVDKLGRLRISNGASLITRNSTGEVVAMVGSKDSKAKDIDGYYNVTTALRQPGSSIKPFNYSLYLQNGHTAASLILDEKVVYKTPGSPAYIPKNYDGIFRGNVTVRRALSNSLNIPAIKVLNSNGIANFISYVKSFGINTWNNDYYGLSLALGAGEVKMTQMNQGFSVFANSGYKVNLNPIKYILNSSGDVLEYNPCLASKDFLEGRRVIYEPGICKTPIIDEGNAYIITSILSDFRARAEEFGTNSVLNVVGTAAKTGTTNDMKDNWTFGFNNEYTVGTWVGNNDNTPMSYVASGITGASPIWAKIISNLTNSTNKLDLTKKPSDIIQLNLCSLTNTLSCDACKGYNEYFIKGTEPTKACSDDQIKKIKQKEQDKKSND